MMELPNHLVPWDTVKQMLKRAWDESHEATCEAHDQYGGLNYTPDNPYDQED